MTQAKAQAVAAALIGAGHQIDRCSTDGTGSWYIYVSAINGDVNVTSISNFATAQGVTATTRSITFV